MTAVGFCPVVMYPEPREGMERQLSINDMRGDTLEFRDAHITECRAAGGDLAAGEFIADVAVFGNVDSYGDRMRKGAFARTLEERGLPPIVWAHDWNEPPIGATVAAEETDTGLRVHGRLFVDANDLAAKVHTAMTENGGDGLPPLREFSFGFRTVASDTVEEDDGSEIREITDVDLYEVGPVLVGANPATSLLAVKTAAPAPPVPAPAGTEVRRRLAALRRDSPPKHYQPKGQT